MKKIFSPILAAAVVLCCAACNNAPKSSDCNCGSKCDSKCACECGLDVVHVQEPVLVEVDSPQVDLSTLTKDADGYYSLFNGETLDGWRGFCKDHVPSRWVVEDGAIKFLGRHDEAIKDLEGGDIVFSHKFSNFVLEFDWKVDEGSNSGVFYLVKEYKYKGSEKFVSMAENAPEYQILDNVNHGDAFRGKDGNRQSASLYDMIPAQPQNSKPWGEWNQGKIVVENGTVSHWQNGVEVVKYQLWTPEWETMLRGCKWAPEKSPVAFACFMNCGGASKKGYIGFQDHGDVVWYKNIRVKEL